MRVRGHQATPRRARPARRPAGRFPIFLISALALGALLAACAAQQIGQTLYNTGRAYCADHPPHCDDGEARRRR